jgi:hypothetical protein
MKKYFLGFTAVVCALALSAFTKPYTMQGFKLKTNPIAANIVNNPAQWTTSATSGAYFGECTGAIADLACKINLDNSRTSYFHTEGGEVILNTETYANSQNPKQDFLVINETFGLHLGGGIYDRIISAIIPRHYNTGTQQYENADLGSDGSFVNAQEVSE